METNCQSNDGCRSVFSVWTEGKNATLRQYYNRKWHRLSRTRFLNIYPSRFYFFEICMIKSRNVRIFSKIWLYSRDREGWTRYSLFVWYMQVPSWHSCSPGRPQISIGWGGVQTKPKFECQSTQWKFVISETS